MDFKWPVPFIPVFIAPLWMIFIAWAFSDAGSNILAFFVVVFGGGLWIVVWLVRVLVWIYQTRRGRREWPAFRKTLLYFGFEPALLILSAALLASGAFMFCRLQLSSSALERYVAAVRTEGLDAPHPATRIGSFEVRETELLPDGIVRMITADDFMDTAGFVYSPAGIPPTIGEDSYTHLTGPWWHWLRSW